MEPVESNETRKSAPMQARNYVFRISFPFDEKKGGWFHGVPRLLDPHDFPHWLQYVVYSLELGEEGTHHFQGYLECVGVKSYKQLHEIPGFEGATFDRRRGTQAQAIAYASKIDDPTYLEGPWIHGHPKEQGKRNDLLEIKEKIDHGVPMTTVMEEHFTSWLRNHRALTEYKRLKTPRRTEKSFVILFLGPSGRGKSTTMLKLAQHLGSFFMTAEAKKSGIYFDGYDGEDVLVMDEFDGYQMTPTMFNRICDFTPCTLPCHGSPGVQMTSRYVLIASNYHPKYWWRKRNANQLYQITRRIDWIWKMGFKYKNPQERTPRHPQVAANWARQTPAPKVLEWPHYALPELFEQKRRRVVERLEKPGDIIVFQTTPGQLPPKDKEEAENNFDF